MYLNVKYNLIFSITYIFDLLFIHSYFVHTSYAHNTYIYLHWLLLKNVLSPSLGVIVEGWEDNNHNKPIIPLSHLL